MTPPATGQRDDSPRSRPYTPEPSRGARPANPPAHIPRRPGGAPSRPQPTQSAPDRGQSFDNYLDQADEDATRISQAISARPAGSPRPEASRPGEWHGERPNSLPPARGHRGPAGSLRGPEPSGQPRSEASHQPAHGEAPWTSADDVFPLDRSWEEQPSAAVPKQRSNLKIGLSILLVLFLFAGAGFSYVIYDGYRTIGNTERFAMTGKIDNETRPADSQSTNILLMGSDTRIDANDPEKWLDGGQRTDTIMVAHIPSDNSAAYVVSIPRDSWVDIPGREGKSKINAAFAYGGAPLMTQTVENLTGVRIDHVMIINFEGFKGVTDALGGVEIYVPKATNDHRYAWNKGTHQMDGEEALNYVRQRYNLPGGDFDRVKRQQNWIRAIMNKAMSRGVLTDRKKMSDLLSAVSQSMATDEELTTSKMLSMGWSLRGLRPNDIAFMTAPVAGTDKSEDGQSIVVLDDTAGSIMWQAMIDDTMTEYIQENNPELLQETVN